MFKNVETRKLFFFPQNLVGINEGDQELPLNYLPAEISKFDKVVKQAMYSYGPSKSSFQGR